MSEVRKVTILMPDWLHDDLKDRAKGRGITVTELIRQAVSLDKMLSDPDLQVLVRKGNDLQKLVFVR